MNGAETSARNLLAAMQALSQASARIGIALEVTRRLASGLRGHLQRPSTDPPWIAASLAELEFVGRELDEAKRLIGEP